MIATPKLRGTAGAMRVSLTATGQSRARKEEEEAVELSVSGQAWFDLLCRGVDGAASGECRADRGLVELIAGLGSQSVPSKRPKRGGMRAAAARLCRCKGVYMSGAVLLVTLVVPFIGAVLNIVTFYAIEAHIVLARFSWFWWFVWVVCFTAMSVSMSHVLPENVGSGIPQLRAIFSGARLSGFLRARLLPVKLFSSVALVSSGLFVGFEGPMVHMGSLVGSFVAQLPPFRRIRESPELFNTLIAVSGGAGLSCTLGAPIGGTLYTIEEVASSYRISQLWYAFLAGVPGAIIFRVLLSWWQAGVTHNQVPFSFLAGVLEPVVIAPFEFGIPELCWAAVLGVVGGSAGVAFIWINSGTVKLTRHLAGRFAIFRHHLAFTALAVVASSLLFYPGWTGDFMCLGPFSVLKDLVTPGDALLIERGWTFIDLRVSLAIFFLVKMPMLAISIAVPASTGFYFATMGCGAALGRMFGLFWSAINPASRVPSDIFALIGASAVSSSVTQSVSTIVIMLELSGRMQLLVPLIIATLTAVSISRRCTQRTGIYERMALNLNLSFVPDLHPSMASMTVEHACTPLQACLVLREDERLARLVELSEGDAEGRNVFPVVGNRDNLFFQGFLSVVDLRIFLRKLKRTCNKLPTVAERECDVAAIYQVLCSCFGQLPISKGFIELSPTTPLPIAHMLFMRVGEDMMPVTTDGKLVSIVYRSDFAAFLHGNQVSLDHNREPGVEKEWEESQISLGRQNVAKTFV